MDTSRGKVMRKGRSRKLLIQSKENSSAKTCNKVNKVRDVLHLRPLKWMPLNEGLSLTATFPRKPYIESDVWRPAVSHEA
jgi:hypothetical protein